MDQSIKLDVPHRLGKAEVRARLEEGVGNIARGIPGIAQSRYNWEGDTLNCTLTALGQSIACRMTVYEEKVHAEIDLPPLLALLGSKVKARFGKELPKLLK